MDPVPFEISVFGRPNGGKGGVCPDCKGTGKYRGLIKVEDCQTCGGKGSL